MAPRKTTPSEKTMKNSEQLRRTQTVGRRISRRLGDRAEAAQAKKVENGIKLARSIGFKTYLETFLAKNRDLNGRQALETAAVRYRRLPLSEKAEWRKIVRNAFSMFEYFLLNIIQIVGCGSVGAGVGAEGQ